MLRLGPSRSRPLQVAVICRYGGNSERSGGDFPREDRQPFRGGDRWGERPPRLRGEDEGDFSRERRSRFPSEGDMTGGTRGSDWTNRDGSQRGGPGGRNGEWADRPARRYSDREEGATGDERPSRSFDRPPREGEGEDRPFRSRPRFEDGGADRPSYRPRSPRPEEPRSDTPSEEIGGEEAGEQGNAREASRWDRGTGRPDRRERFDREGRAERRPYTGRAAGSDRFERQQQQQAPKGERQTFASWG